MYACLISIFSVSKKALENQTSILNATVRQREKFIQLIEAEIKLQLVEIPHWAGLGGVCYIPPEQRRTPDDPDFDLPYTPEELHLINHKNVQLINELRTLDKAFSLGEGKMIEKILPNEKITL